MKNNRSALLPRGADDTGPVMPDCSGSQSQTRNDPVMQNAVAIEGNSARPSHNRLLRIVGAFTVCLIIVSALSLLYIGHIASDAADGQAADTERHLFANVLKSHQSLMARDTSSMAHWDDAVQGIAIKFDPEFVRDTFVYSLSHDYGQRRTFLIDPEGNVVMSARGDDVDLTNRELAPDSDLAIIASKAVETSMRFRIPVRDGFSQQAVKTSHIGDVSVFAFALVDGKPAIVVAMAVVPGDEEVLLPAGNPYVLLSAKAIDRDLLRDLNLQLSFADLGFGLDGVGKVPAVSASGKPLGSFNWRNAGPGSHIWDVAIPVILALSFFLVLAGIFVVRHVSRLSAKLAASERRIRHFALHDPLSGLPNRLQFDEALAAAIASRRPFAAIACDLDRFKVVNDTHGHAAGDQVIRTVSVRLREAVGEHGLVGRTGGDEFVILVTGFCDHDRLMLTATKIMMSVGLPIPLESGAIVGVGISLGISTAPGCGQTPKEIMAKADAALYASKTGGRGRVAFAADLGLKAANA